eukprot:g6379.t1
MDPCESLVNKIKQVTQSCDSGGSVKFGIPWPSTEKPLRSFSVAFDGRPEDKISLDGGVKLSNIASPNMETTQSSTDNAKNAAFAVDGDETATSCTSTTLEVNPWWRIDLGTEEFIHSVRAVDCADECCRGGLQNMEVGAVCSQPCPYGERCESELVGVTEPFTAPGYWQNFASKDMIDGRAENSDWWENPGIQSGTIKTDADGEGVGTGQIRRLQEQQGADDFVTETSRRTMAGQTPYCDWSQDKCMPGEFLDPVQGACRILTDKDADRLYQCIEGKKFYVCPLGSAACPGSKHLCMNDVSGKQYVCMEDPVKLEKTVVVGNTTVLPDHDVSNDVCSSGYMGPMYDGKFNYGVQWPPLLAEYMRLFGVVNVDLVKVAAMDCIYRSDYYFGLAIVCSFPIAFLGFLFIVGLIGRASFITRLKGRPRRCVRSGQKVNHWMPRKMYMKMRMRAAKANLEKDPTYLGMTADGKAKALEKEVGASNSSLPIGCSIHKTEEFARDVTERLPESEIQKICRGNISVWKKNCRERLEYLRFVNKLWKIFFWSLLLVYPSLSTRIIRLFACTQIGAKTVLVFDNSVQCFTTKWLSYMTGAIVAGLIFVVGIPALFLILLKRARELDVAKNWAIGVRFPKKRQLLLKEAKEDADLHQEFWTLDKDGDGEHTIKEEEVAVKHFLRRKNMRFYRTYDRLGFIYYAYKEDIWWYELTELMRKLLLNGFMVLVPQGVVSRVTVGLLVCLVFLLVLNHVRPYKAASDDLLQNMCHVQLFLTIDEC